MRIFSCLVSDAAAVGVTLCILISAAMHCPGCVSAWWETAVTRDLRLRSSLYMAHKFTVLWTWRWATTDPTSSKRSAILRGYFHAIKVYQQGECLFTCTEYKGRHLCLLHDYVKIKFASVLCASDKLLYISIIVQFLCQILGSTMSVTSALHRVVS